MDSRQGGRPGPQALSGRHRLPVMAAGSEGLRGRRRWTRWRGQVDENADYQQVMRTDFEALRTALDCASADGGRALRVRTGS